MTKSEGSAHRREPRGDSDGHGSDLALLHGVCQQDRDAFAALYTRFYGRLHRFLVRLLRREDQAEELINDVMMTVWQNASDFQGRSRVATWILGIAYKMALKRLRTNANRREDTWDVAPEINDEPSLDKALSDAELRSAVKQALAGLPVEHRAVVVLTFFHGYSYTEIASIVQCPPNTVKTRMYHARGYLRRLLPRAALWDGANE